MSEERLIAIVSIPKDWADVDISQLPKMRIEQRSGRSYSFPEKEVIDTALKEMLNSSDSSTSSAIFLVVDITKEARRRRRRRRREGGEV